MRYMFVNMSGGNLQIDLHNPEKPNNRRKLHRMGPEVVIALKRGESKDILPYYNKSLELAHAAVKFSKDVIQSVATHKLIIYICDDSGKPIDVEKLLKNEDSKKPIVEKKLESYPVPPVKLENTKPDVKPDVEIVATTVTQNQVSKHDEITPSKSYKKYKRVELKGMQKKELLKVAHKLNIVVDKNTTNEEIIETILGAQ